MRGFVRYEHSVRSVRSYPPKHLSPFLAVVCAMQFDRHREQVGTRLAPMTIVLM